MADKMTLEQVRADIRDCNKKHLLPSLSDLRNWADAIGAHLAGMGEPVGYVHPCYLGGNALAMEVSPVRLSKDQMPVYLAPPASGDWDKVREAIADLRKWPSKPDELWIADRLTAALPESLRST